MRQENKTKILRTNTYSWRQVKLREKFNFIQITMFMVSLTYCNTEKRTDLNLATRREIRWCVNYIINFATFNINITTKNTRTSAYNKGRSRIKRYGKLCTDSAPFNDVLEHRLMTNLKMIKPVETRKSFVNNYYLKSCLLYTSPSPRDS